MSMAKFNTLGVTRLLSSKYVEFKRNLNSNNLKKVSLNDSGSLINDSGKINLISQKENNLVEMTNWHLPPKYVESFDSTNDILKELQIKFARLQEEQQKRIMPKFDDEENKQIDKLIHNNLRDMTDKIKECEENIKKMGFEKIKSEKESLVRDNMKKNLLYKLSDFTRKLKINEEEYMKKYKELVGDDVKYASNTESNLNFNTFESGNKRDNFLKMENSNDILAKRDNEINNLVSCIHELATLFKDFQVLVLEQGTILDRIDYNIDTSLTNMNQAFTQLEKANKNMKKNCARNTNIIIIFIIFILSVLLLLKYFK